MHMNITSNVKFDFVLTDNDVEKLKYTYWNDQEILLTCFFL